MKPIRLLLVDDHAIVRKGLISLLNATPGLSVIGDAADGAAAVRLAQKLKPDVIISDLIMPDMDGTETTRLLLADDPEAKVLILTTFGTADALGHALDAGARGAILKSASCDELVAAIRAVAAGKTSVAPEIEQMLLESPPLPTLTQRQLEMLRAVVRGLSNEDIAKLSGISVNAVKKHLKLLFEKLNVATRAEAAALALKKHLL